MKKIILLLCALWAAQASAQLLHGVSDALSGGGTPSPPVCSNKYDFSQACNSQYIVVGPMR